MSEHYDLIVVGGGSGGVRAARLFARAGKSVAIVEADRWGGTCVNLGCVPKKMMKYAADFSQEFTDASDYGWSGLEPRFDWATFVARRDAEITRLSSLYADALKRAGATLVEGRARIIGPQEVVVGDRSLRGERILIATGSMPVLPGVEGASLGITSDDLFTLDRKPDRLLIVGGGFVALEFASIFRGLGSDVTLSYRGDLFLRGFDRDTARHAGTGLEGRGVKLRFLSEVLRVEACEDGSRHATLNGGETLIVDQVLFATGRVPNTRELWSDDCHIETDAGGQLVVDKNFRTSVDSIFALGDVVGRLALTPVAIAEAKALVAHWLENQPVELDYETIPYAVFSAPGIATVGMSEDRALEEYGRALIYETSFRSLKLSLTSRQEETYIKMVVEPDSERVLGVHLVGEEVAEILQCAALAINLGATKADFDRTVGIHPTTAEELVTLSRHPRIAEV